MCIYIGKYDTDAHNTNNSFIEPNCKKRQYSKNKGT